MSSIAINQGSVSRPGEGQILPLIGRLKVISAQTGDAFEVIELAPGRAGGPPPHIHHDHDECFYIIEGLYQFVLGAEEVEAPAGSVVFVPRGTRHAFKHGEGARALVFVNPAGIEGFFRELGAGLMAGLPEAELRAELAGKYDSHPINMT